MFVKKVSRKVENRSSIPRDVDISVGGDSGERGWRAVSEFTRAELFCTKKCRICKRVLFYKEEIDIAIRIKSFQFVKSARRLKCFGKKYMKKAGNQSSIPRCVDISAGGDAGERSWRTVCFKKLFISKF